MPSITNLLWDNQSLIHFRTHPPIEMSLDRLNDKAHALPAMIAKKKPGAKARANLVRKYIRYEEKNKTTNKELCKVLTLWLKAFLK